MRTSQGEPPPDIPGPPPASDIAAAPEAGEARRDSPPPRGLRGLLGRLRRRLADGLEQSGAAAEPMMVAAGLMGFVGQPLFYVIWGYVFPQPYENLTIRLVASALCVPAIFKDYWPARLRRWRAAYWVLALWFNIPLLFSYFLLANNLSQMWLFAMIGGMFVLTFMVDLLTAILMAVSGAFVAYAAHRLLVTEAAQQAATLRSLFSEDLLVALFPLVFGGIVNHRLQRYRRMQHAFELRLRNLTAQHARVVQEQNNLLSRFLSNVIVARLRRFQTQLGLEEALARITQQETRFCGIMQADVRNFTRMLGQEPEIQVAQLIRRCFMEIADLGQDLAVVKTVGDMIFLYSDDEAGRQNAVFDVLALAIMFVHTLQETNAVLAFTHSSQLNFGIAVHAGEVIYGNLASETLIDPTIIGIHANKVARLEELTKAPVVRQLVGGNAIIFSDEIAFYGSNFIDRKHLVELDLKALGLTLRDFPQVERVYALPGDVAVTYLSQATEHIRAQRARLSAAVGNSEVNAYHGVSYYYQMQGTGPNTTWLALIDVSDVPTRVVSQFVLQALQDVECEINHSDGQWLVVSTRNLPGELDEMDLEARIFSIIDGLQEASRATSS